MHEYIGVIHIHSKYSDGTGKIPEIARFAQEVGLDFIGMTDHNTLRPKRDGHEGWHDSVMVLIGYEINDKQDKNHYLAFGLDKTVGVRISANEYVRRVKEQGGFGFLAHPDEKRNSMPEHPPYPWLAWDSKDFHGIEIWNHMSEWMEGLTEQNKFQRFIHPLKSITAPPRETLKKWDDLNRLRKVVAIGGVDAHAHKADVLGFFNVEAFPYKVMFKSIRTHVLLDEPIHRGQPEFFETDKRNIYEALKEGRSFIANSYHADASGFGFVAVQKDEKHEQGSFVPFHDGPIDLFVTLPQSATLKLICDGRVVQAEFTTQMKHRVLKPGAYRTEAWIGRKGWIFSNHIRIGDDSGKW
jgi:hypothetical protein